MSEEHYGVVTFKGAPLTAIGPRLALGDQAPDFAVVAGDLSTVNLAATGARLRLFNVVPSLDTPICSQQTRRFDEELASFANIGAYTISADLPFAQKRFCSDAAIGKIQTLSDHRELSFGRAYGVAIKELRLLQRAVFVVDAAGIIRHVQYVTEVASHPDYDAVLGCLRELAA
jgi:thiol peroxidase